MAKGTVSPFLEAGPTDLERRGRPISSSKFRPRLPPVYSSRTSVLSSVVPYLRRQDVSEDMSSGHHKVPLLTLKLSSSSFLDSVVNDDLTQEPLYVIKTVGTSTTIKRADPWEGDAKTADIKWPKVAPTKGKGISDGILIQMRGARWKGGETLLKRGTLLSAPRKFNIPNYSHNLRWKRVGTSYWCTATAVKGPIAIFEPAFESVPPRLRVFETLHEKYDARPMLVHQDVQDWMLIKKFEGKDIVVPPVGEKIRSPNPPKSAPGAISASASQWRKIVFGEPLYPKRSSHSAHSSVSSEPTRPDIASPSMTTAERNNSLYPKLSTSSPDLSTSESEDEDDHMFFSPIRTRPPSPSAESIFYPLTNSSAPSHTYLDPSFYNEDGIPPVPSIPIQYRASRSSLTYSSRPSTANSATSVKRLRELPAPPVALSIPRPRSTPPRAMPSTDLQSVAQEMARSLPPTRQLPSPGPGRANSVAGRPLRQLPRPPSSGLPNTDNQTSPRIPCGRARSQSSRPREKWNPPYRQRTLPSPPIGSSAGGIHPNQGPRQRTCKEAEDDLSRWVHFDVPPPAYNSINFFAGLALTGTPPPPPLPPPPLSSGSDDN